MLEFVSGALDKLPPRNPATPLTSTGHVWVPADPADVFSPYIETNPLQTETYLQGSVLHFDVKLDKAGRLPADIERSLTKKFGKRIDQYHDAVVDSATD